MRVIDVHVHVFDVLKGFNGKGELCPIGGGRGRFASGEIVDMIPEYLGEQEFTYESCYQFLKKQGVEKAVLLQGNFYGFANEYVLEAAQRHPDMFLPLGIFDPFGKWADAIYNRLTHEMHLTGIKFELSTGCGLTSYHDEFDIAEKMDKIAADCEKNEQTMVLDIGSPGMTSFQPKSVAVLAKRHPGLKIVVCHLLAPGRGDEEALKRGLEVLSLPNVYFDLAAVPFNVYPEEYPYSLACSYVKDACDIVGYQKLMWGTDIPSVLFRNSYEQNMNYLYDSEMFSKKELQAIMYENACKVYRFD